MTSAPTVPSLEIVLEFARKELTGDPHAFRFAPQSYTVRTHRGRYFEVTLAWKHELLDQLTAIRAPRPDPRLLADVGEAMRCFVEPAGWQLHEARITEAIHRQEPVNVTIRSAAAELYVLPWELLALRATGQNLGGLPGLLLRYEWPETATTPRSKESSNSRRILVAWSDAGGAVPANEHIVAIREAAAAVCPLTEDDILAHASPTQIATKLACGDREGRPYATLHLLCHGGVHDGHSGLVLNAEAPDGDSIFLDPARLQQLLTPHSATVRLIVLTACDSGNLGKLGGRLGSVAQRLHRAGFATVIASRYPLSVSGSQRLTTAFYQALLVDNRPPERAFVAARTVLAYDTSHLDWASVQLYARRADAVVQYNSPPPRESNGMCSTVQACQGSHALTTPTVDFSVLPATPWVLDWPLEQRISEFCRSEPHPTCV